MIVTTIGDGDGYEDVDEDEEDDEDHVVVKSHMSSYVHLVAQVAVEQGNSCGRDLKVAADRVSQSEQEVIMVVVMTVDCGGCDVDDSL